jgi:rod shape-determining protein MreD
MKAAGVLLAFVVALTLQTTIAGLSIGGGGAVNLVLVAVVYIALAYGAGAGLVAGTVGGLVQDALAGAILGIGGLSMTLVGFVVGVLGAHFIVSQPLPRLVMFVGATVVHELCFQGLSALAEGRGLQFHFTTVLTQAALNGLIGIIAFQVVEHVPGLVQRRRLRGESLSARRY